MEMWGEIPIPNDDWDKIVPKEKEKFILLCAIEPDTPEVQQLLPDEDGDQLIILGPEHSTMENNVLYTIQLIDHARKVTELIRNATSKEDDGRNKIKDCPVLPNPPDMLFKCDDYFPRRYNYNEYSPFTRDAIINTTPLGREITKEILFKTVGTICAHAGYESALQSTLQVLTDIAEEFLKKFTRLYKYAVDREELYGKSGFPDAMERVFHEMGFGSMVCLHKFYQQRVLLYRDKCEEASIKLQEQYLALVSSLKVEPDDTRQFKTEPDTEKNIPEIHFPAMAEGDCVAKLRSPFKCGLEILDSIEQEDQQHVSTEQDEGDANCIDSPQSGESSQPLPEQWTTTVKSKKRKRKHQ